MKLIITEMFRPRQSSLLWGNKANIKKIWNDNSKDINSDERGNRDSLCISHKPSVYSSRNSC